MRCLYGGPHGCTALAVVRGVCWADYMRARRAIARGSTSWAALEALGWARPAGPSARRRPRAPAAEGASFFASWSGGAR